MAGEQMHGFDEAGAKRIVAAVRRSEATPRNLRRDNDTQRPMFVSTKFLCKNTGTIWAVGTTRDINLYAGPQGAETDTGQTITGVYNRMGSIPANAWCYVEDIAGNLEVWVPSC
jgi:hypothetical protein